MDVQALLSAPRKGRDGVFVQEATGLEEQHFHRGAWQQFHRRLSATFPPLTDRRPRWHTNCATRQRLARPSAPALREDACFNYLFRGVCLFELRGRRLYVANARAEKPAGAVVGVSFHVVSGRLMIHSREKIR